MRYFAFVFSALLVCASPRPSVDKLPNASAFRWHGHLAAGQAIEVKGINGEIRAEGTSGTEVEVIAHKVGRHGDISAVELALVEHSGGVTICAVYPGLGTGGCVPGKDGRAAGPQNDVRVDFTVLVPAGVRFVGRTVNGGITATSLKADTEAYTVNGRIQLSTAGAAQARTVNGSIIAALGDPFWSKTREFSTVNGAIDLSLPSSTSAELRASTVNGGISADFPLTACGEILGKHISTRIGRGGRQLRLTTVNGSIRLHQLGRIL